MTESARLRKAKWMSWIAAGVAAAALAGCGGGDSGAGSADTTGTLGVSMTTSTGKSPASAISAVGQASGGGAINPPNCGLDAVHLTVNKVRIHSSDSASEVDGGWTEITVNRKINLLALSNGALEALGQVPLAAGHYTQLRLVLDANTGSALANSVVPAGATETALVTPSAVQSGIKLVGEFTVLAGQRADTVLDFDVCKSIVRNGDGSFALKPVIQVAPFVLNGIDGFVDTALLGSGVTVSAQQNGAVIRSTTPTSTGEFFLGRLAVGNYDVVLRARGHGTAVVAAVPVVSNTSIAVLSTRAVPLALPASATRTVSGTAALDPGIGSPMYLRALQSVAATAPGASVWFTAADYTSSPPGAYAMTLPTAAPLLGQFSLSLPIALVAQTGSQGKYSVEASASAYQSQTVEVDISGASVVADFVLLP
jgi:hypothetical protein